MSHVTEEVLTGAEQLSGMVGQVRQETPVGLKLKTLG